MPWKELLIVLVVMAAIILLLSVRVIFKKNGKFEKSCDAKHRMMKDKGIDCSNCSYDPSTCALDDKEHHEFMKISDS